MTGHVPFNYSSQLVDYLSPLYVGMIYIDFQGIVIQIRKVVK
jgi:hypothetical protein